ncbi:TetR/AcrR family transcriptional regulator [Camelimonas lactis]|uniref:TetR family transcriptional regulator n=1 Tax=Camelimonas lactis TaxID=659006 RepID=A0A4R2GLI6_9HYPH|nr:TetR/AcrR family transcriptional regulator [Camelimonas lactis]TCO09509.1 TetR family transcriptional regulator [Camelimonas lactis]
MRRSNEARSGAMRAALMAAGREIFVSAGFAAATTPAIVAAAGVTRGALYHHFTDKTALFEAVIRAEAGAVAAAIDAATVAPADPLEALRTGGRAFLQAMKAPGRARLLLVEGPAVLGPAAMAAIDAATGAATLRAGLAEAMAQGLLRPLPPDATAQVLSAGYDRAALAIAGGADVDAWVTVMDALLEGLATRR